MDNDKTEHYLKNLIYQIRAEEELWRESHAYYGNERMTEAAWDSVARKTNIMYNTDKITVENAKYTWKNLLEAFKEREENATATIFSLYSNLLFLYQDPEGLSNRKNCDDMFGRKKGKYLIFLQLILNIVFIGCVIYFAPITAERKLCNSEFALPVLVLFVSMYILVFSEIQPTQVRVTQTARRTLFGVLILGPILIAFSFYLSTTGSECATPVSKPSVVIVTLIVTVGMGQVITIFIHATKLERPPTMNEMSTVLATELVLAVMFTLPLITSQWKEFYLVTSGWIWTNFFILLSYYAICHRNAKTLYKFEKKKRLVAVSSQENPFNIKFEREVN